LLTVVWDVDETLNHYIQELLVYINFCLDKNINFENIKYYNLTKSLPFLTEVECWYYLDKFKFIGKYEELKPNEKIYEWFQKYGHKAYHIALTAASLRASHISASWIFQNFGQWIRGIQIIPSDPTENVIIYDKKKIDWLKRNKADIYIEDCEENYIEAKKLGFESLLIKKPWNNGESIEIVLEKLTNFLGVYDTSSRLHF
jgi:5'(3')-deoxyribonucleotidase